MGKASVSRTSRMESSRTRTPATSLILPSRYERAPSIAAQAEGISGAARRIEVSIAALAFRAVRGSPSEKRTPRRIVRRKGLPPPPLSPPSTRLRAAARLPRGIRGECQGGNGAAGILLLLENTDGAPALLEGGADVAPPPLGLRAEEPGAAF